MMKSNSSINATLKRKTITSPLSVIGGSVWYCIAALLTVVVFTLLVNLGFWQLERGEEKQVLESELTSRASAPHLPIAQLVQLDQLDEFESSATGLKVKAELSDTDSGLIYWDNQTHKGKVGYLVYQLFHILNSEQYLLVELGFVRATLSRDRLPEVSVRLGSGTVQGRIYARESNPLSSQLMPEKMSQIRVQNLNFSQLSTFLNLPLYPFALQPDNLSNWPLSQPWLPIPMPSSKHFAYAFQWFVMAAVWMLIMLSLWVKVVRKTNRSGK